MKVRIRAFFSDEKTAREAGAALAAPDKTAMGLVITTDCMPQGGRTLGGARMTAAVGGPVAGGASGQYVVSVICASESESYVVSELAARGAGKISICL